MVPESREDGEKSKLKLVIPVIVAIIGCCGAVLAAFVGIWPEVWKLIVTPSSSLSTTSAPTLIPASPSASDQPLSISELWPENTVCHPGGTWSADLWVRSLGGTGTMSTI